MKLIDKPITIDQLKEIAQELFGDVTKAVVDINKEIMIVNAELHADEEAWLVEHNSNQQNLWGINLYPELYQELDFIEFDSMINLRPSQGNVSRGVEDEKIRNKINKIVYQLVVNET